jgi:hypothetical protein
MRVVQDQDPGRIRGKLTFFLGTHRPHWLGIVDVPLFVSRRALEPRRSFPRALAGWCLDSGGFSELSQYGEWRLDARRYARMVRLYSREIGSMRWAACQDWMCEDHILKETGKTVADHQRLTVNNYLDLRTMAPELPIIPVLQGWLPDDYLRHADMYEACGISLAALDTVGIGSVCRRQSMQGMYGLIYRLHSRGIRLHGFGVKVTGLRSYGQYLQSSDSMAWSYTARRQRIRLEGCSHQNCTNCRRWALRWRRELLASLDPVREPGGQLDLFGRAT